MKYVLVVTLLISSIVQAASLRRTLERMSQEGHYPIEYAEAKQYLYEQIFAVDGKVYDIYCGKFFRKYSNGVNVEHTWPQSKFNKHITKETQKGDLYHLFTVDRGANSARGSDPFADVKGGALNSECQLSKAGEAKEGKNIYAFEPPDGYKGDIARGMFYFAVRYNLQIERVQELSFRRWHHEDPVSDEEYERSIMIELIQGNINPFIEYPEYVDQLENF